MAADVLASVDAARADAVECLHANHRARERLRRLGCELGLPLASPLAHPAATAARRLRALSPAERLPPRQPLVPPAPAAGATERTPGAGDSTLPQGACCARPSSAGHDGEHAAQRQERSRQREQSRARAPHVGSAMGGPAVERALASSRRVADALDAARHGSTARHLIGGRAAHPAVPPASASSDEAEPEDARLASSRAARRGGAGRRPVLEQHERILTRRREAEMEAALGRVDVSAPALARALRTLEWRGAERAPSHTELSLIAAVAPTELELARGAAAESAGRRPISRAEALVCALARVPDAPERLYCVAFHATLAPAAARTRRLASRAAHGARAASATPLLGTLLRALLGGGGGAEAGPAPEALEALARDGPAPGTQSTRRALHALGSGGGASALAAALGALDEACGAAPTHADGAVRRAPASAPGAHAAAVGAEVAGAGARLRAGLEAVRVAARRAARAGHGAEAGGAAPALSTDSSDEDGAGSGAGSYARARAPPPHAAESALFGRRLGAFARDAAEELRAVDADVERAARVCAQSAHRMCGVPAPPTPEPAQVEVLLRALAALWALVPLGGGALAQG